MVDVTWSVAGWFCVLRGRLEFVFEGDCLLVLESITLAWLPSYEDENSVLQYSHSRRSAIWNRLYAQQEFLEERGLEKLRKELWKR